MELQLNIKTGGKKPKQKQKSGQPSNSTKSDYSFVSKPIMEGKTIAKIRNKPPETTKNAKFSFLNKKDDSADSKSVKKFDKTDKKYEKIKTESKKEETIENNDELSSDLSMNIKNIPVKKKNKNSKTEHATEKEYNTSINNTQKKNETNKPQTIKRTINSHISSLFRNNPDIPKVGQRLVTPIKETVFSRKNFQELDVHSFSVANLEKNMGLQYLTVVQQKACPVILEGRDVLVRSQTGSGKTLAYALPIVEALQAIRPKLKRDDGIKALVIVPTRELALQTYELFVKLVRPFTWIVPGYLIGGEKRKAEKARIRKGFNILIGTPGRICDHILHTASLSLGKTRCLILDEADRLLDMGYEKDVSSIVDSLKKDQVADKYDPMALVRESVQKNHIHFGEEENEGDESEDNVTKSDKRKESDDVTDGEVVTYKHNLSNVFLSDRRQTVLLSATLTKAVETLAGLTMEDPVFIDTSEGRATLIADSLASKVIAPPSIVAEEQITKKVDNSEEDDFEIVPQETSDEEKDESEDEKAESDADSEHQDDVSKSDDLDNDKDDSDNDDDEDDSDNDDDKDDSDNDEDSSEDGSSADDETGEVDKSELKLYKGLKAFAGFKPEIKEKTKKKKEKSEKNKETVTEQKTKLQESKKQRIKATDGGSDSDSDYDFFAVSKVDIKESKDDKKIKKNKKEKSEKKMEAETTFLTQCGDYDNPFQNALKNAIIQDEMVIPSSVTQLYILAPMKLRLVTLSALIIERCVRPGKGKMLIFMATQDMIDYHCELLSRVLTGKKPHNILIEEKQDSFAKRSRKYVKKKNSENADDSNSDIDNKTNEQESSKTNKRTQLTVDTKKTETNDEYEYKFDGMDLAEYEAKMKEKEAYVNVQFFQLHGSMNQKTRTEVFNTFRKASSGVLLCTTRPVPEFTRRLLSDQPLDKLNKFINRRSVFADKLEKYKKARERIANQRNSNPKYSLKAVNNCLKKKIRRLKRRMKKHSDRNPYDMSHCLSSMNDRCGNYSDNCDRNTNNSRIDKSNKYDDPSSKIDTQTNRSDKNSLNYCDNSVNFYKLDESMDDITKTTVVKNFDSSHCSVLFCTDVAARGLDLPHVDCIVQYTGPISVTDYVHRVGRTARAGNVGMAVMILLPSEVEFVTQLGQRRIRVYQEDMEVSHKALLQEADTGKQQQKNRSGGPTPVQLAAAKMQQSYEELVKSDKELYIKACKAFTSWLRFYSTYPREARVAFDRRALHIGHAATALALTDTPKKIGKEAPKPVNRKDSDLKRRAEREKHLPKVKLPSVKAAKREKQMLVSEFESGLEPSKKKAKFS